eukprot:358264-Chlamydomonas_euryale.AAC.3
MRGRHDAWRRARACDARLLLLETRVLPGAAGTPLVDGQRLRHWHAAALLAKRAAAPAAAATTAVRLRATRGLSDTAAPRHARARAGPGQARPGQARAGQARPGQANGELLTGAAAGEQLVGSGQQLAAAPAGGCRELLAWVRARRQRFRRHKVHFKCNVNYSQRGTGVHLDPAKEPGNLLPGKGPAAWHTKHAAVKRCDGNVPRPFPRVCRAPSLKMMKVAAAAALLALLLPAVAARTLSVSAHIQWLGRPRPSSRGSMLPAPFHRSVDSTPDHQSVRADMATPVGQHGMRVWPASLTAAWPVPDVWLPVGGA